MIIQFNNTNTKHASLTMSSEQFHAWAAKAPKGQLEPWSYTPRPLGPRDVQINITHCGICGTDVHQIDGGWGPMQSQYPLVPGHEIIGHVTKIGSEVTRFVVGDRVGVGAQCQTCHDCDNCKAHLEAYCHKGVVTYNGVYADGKLSYGGYAENVRVDERFTFKIPDNLKSEEAAPLLCAGVTVYSPLKHYGAAPNKKVGIIGIGGLGHLGIKFARALGSEVYAISTSSSKEKEATALGAHYFINTKDKESFAKGQGQLDLIICTINGSGINWDSYLSLLARDGTFALVGAPEEDLKFNGFNLLFRRAKVGGSLIGSPDEIEEMLQLASKDGIGANVQVFPIEKVNDAIEGFRKGSPRYRYVLQLKQDSKSSTL